MGIVSAFGRLYKWCLMIRVWQYGSVLSGLMMALVAQADVALMGVYDPTYAQDFRRCPTHFAGQMPPQLHSQAWAVDSTLYELCFLGFATLYVGANDAKWHTALFSAEYLTKERVLRAKTLPRIDSFRAESRLPSTIAITPKEYQGALLDRGHLAPNADMAEVRQQYDSFSLANIVPQHREHNRALWRHIEAHTRTLAQEYGEVYVVTGTSFHGQTLAHMKGVLIPTHLYKAVYVPKRAIAMVYYSPNDGSGSYQLLSLSEFAKVSGIIVFPSLAQATIGTDKDVFAIDTNGEVVAKKEVSVSVATFIKKAITALWQALN